MARSEFGIGKSYEKMLNKLVTNGSWSILDSEEGWFRLANMKPSDNRIFEIEHADGIITGICRIR